MSSSESDIPSDRADRFVPRAPLLPIVAVAVVVVGGIVLRFVTDAHLWLDEALTVNIAKLSLPDLLDALRRDGHPPAYYLVLHGWMDLVGEGDMAIRALSGLFSVAALPLAYIAGVRRGGRRVGVCVVALTAIAPFCVRHATEARMYSLVMVLVFAALLIGEDLWSEPGRLRWASLAMVTAVALLTHYWVFFLGAAAVTVLGYAWIRHGRRCEAIRVASALAVGALAFVPWLPSFLDQLAHTGTPWATAGRPTRAVVELIYGIGGGDHAEGVLLGALVLALCVVGALGASNGGASAVLESRVQRTVGVDVALVVITFGLGLAVGLLTDSVFVARYAAVIMPMVLIVAGRGIAVLPSGVVSAAAAVAVVLTALPGLVLGVVEDRTQGGDHAQTITAVAHHGDVVAFCPDQLGPSTARGLGDDPIAVGVPALDSAHFVDWVDYEERNRSADPAAVAASLLEMAGDGRIFLVTMDTYRTYETLCPALRDALAAARGPGAVLGAPDPDVFEPSSLIVFEARSE